MDSLLRSKYFCFSIDRISVTEDKTFYVTLIPDINSEFFPPFHLRKLRVSEYLLEEDFVKTKFNINENKGRYKGSIVQGGYYKIPSSEFLKLNVLKSKESIITLANDIFEEKMIPSPYKEEDYSGKNTIESDNLYYYLSETKEEVSDKLFLYCFNVGQGDSFLLILPNGSTYMIDTNIYGRDKAEKFCQNLKSILSEHGLPKNKIKSLIITHKHLDHLRGAKYILENGDFEISNFLVNLDYLHPTKVVKSLLNTARNKIPVFCNTNTPGIIKENDVFICIKNPDSNSNTRTVAPDINDSSICLCIRHLNNGFFLTGDAGYRIIEDNFQCNGLNEKKQKVFKVSHHGSITGTSQQSLDLLSPTHAFVSAGSSKKYKHPHSNTMNLLNHNVQNVIVSKIVRRDVVYISDGNSIDYKYRH